MDTGANATVANGEAEFPEYSLEESPGSRANQGFVGAGSQRIDNRGQRRVRLKIGSPTGRSAKITFQDAAVRRPICSVGETNDAGSMCVFDKQESVVLPKGCPEIEAIRRIIEKAKGKIAMQRTNNTFVLPAWVEVPFQGQGK